MELGTEFIVKKDVAEIVTEEKEVQRKVMLSVDVDSLQNGLLQKVTPKHFGLFMLLVCHMNSEKESFPSVDTLKEELGCSKQKVLDGIKHLKTLKVGGKPLVVVEKRTGGSGWQKNVYKLQLPEVSESTLDKEGYMDSKEIVSCFKEEYLQVYGIPYAGKEEFVRISEKIQGKYEDALVCEVIKYAVEKFDTQWRNGDYLRPTVGMLASWLFQQALEKVQQEKEKQQQFEQRVQAAEAVEQIDSAALLDA